MGGGVVYHTCIFVVYMLFKVVGSHNDVSVLSKSVMGLKKVLIGGGWVG